MNDVSIPMTDVLDLNFDLKRVGIYSAFKSKIVKRNKNKNRYKQQLKLNLSLKYDYETAIWICYSS